MVGQPHDSHPCLDVTGIWHSHQWRARATVPKVEWRLALTSLRRIRLLFPWIAYNHIHAISRLKECEKQFV